MVVRVKRFSGTRIMVAIMISIIFVMCVLIVVLYLTSYHNFQVYGESFSLSKTDAKSFLYAPQTVSSVYGYCNDGVIYYQENVDYIIDYKAGTIRRTENSAIPDYSRHKVSYNEDGKFTFCSDPRNPELNVSYQIFVDYETKRYRDTLIESQNGYLSEKFKNKLNYKDKVLLSIVGDSIGGGAQTSSQYYKSDNISSTFMGYLRNFLEDTYGITVDVDNYSGADKTRGYLLNNIQTLVDSKPDMVFIEFGMNDHVSEIASNEKEQESFHDDIEKAVVTLKSENIDVVIVGFFQENPDWELEKPVETYNYNRILRQIARENDVYYADVATLFEVITRYKDLEEDLTADYMHHPTDFGHKLYFTQIVPIFLPLDTYSYEIKDYITLP